MIESILAGATAGTGLLNAGIGAWQAHKNYELEKSNYKYQQQIQREMMAREDTATQRRVKDLRLAGLSPVLAAGQAAGAGPVVSTVAPRVEAPQIPDIASAVMTMLRQQADITQTNEQSKLTQLQQAKTVSEIGNLMTQQAQMEASIKNMNSQTAKNLIEAKTSSRDLDIAKSAGLSSKPSPQGALVRDVASWLDQLGQDLANTFSGGKQK